MGLLGFLFAIACPWQLLLISLYLASNLSPVLVFPPAGPSKSMWVSWVCCQCLMPKAPVSSWANTGWLKWSFYTNVSCSLANPLLLSLYCCQQSFHCTEITIPHQAMGPFILLSYLQQEPIHNAAEKGDAFLPSPPHQHPSTVAHKLSSHLCNVMCGRVNSFLTPSGNQLIPWSISLDYPCHCLRLHSHKCYSVIKLPRPL